MNESTSPHTLCVSVIIIAIVANSSQQLLWWAFSSFVEVAKTLMYGLADVIMYLEIVLLLSGTVTLLPQKIMSRGTELFPPRDSRM